MEAVTRADVTKLHHDLRGTPYQANRVLALLSKMFSLAESWELRPYHTNPCYRVEKYKEKSRERFLSPAELAKLGTTLAEVEAEGLESPSAVLAIRLLTLTGCRRGEIETLKREYVNLEVGCLDLPDSKTGRKRVMLGAPALELLKNAPRKAGNPYVCPGKLPMGHFAGLGKAWRRIRKRAGLKNVRLHDLRHSYAAIGAGAGLSLPIIGALLGHVDQQTTAKYAHLAPSPVQQAADLITGQIAAAMGATPPPPKVVNLPDRAERGSS